MELFLIPSSPDSFNALRFAFNQFAGAECQAGFGNMIS